TDAAIPTTAGKPLQAEAKVTEDPDQSLTGAAAPGKMPVTPVAQGPSPAAGPARDAPAALGVATTKPVRVRDGTGRPEQGETPQ
ncbi:hypothetical protein, partial [Clostridium perfringens]